MRIVSIVPSLTELLFDLGLEKELVGRTKFCIHPAPDIKSIPKIGGTKTVNISAVEALQPDLIIANKEENTKADVLALQKISQVYVSDISNFAQALESIEQIGRLTGRTEEAEILNEGIRKNFRKLPGKEGARKKVAYLIWKAPLMTIGHDTFIHDMLEICGFENVFGVQTRYPIITPDDLQKERPDYIFLSSEPFPFKDKHINEIEKILPDSKVVLVDGEYFSWYGSRMLAAADYFERLIKEL